MKSEFFDRFNEETLRHEALVISSFTCPNCREIVRFVVADQIRDFRSLTAENKHYKELCSKLMKDNYDLKMFCRRLANQPI